MRFQHGHGRSPCAVRRAHRRGRARTAYRMSLISFPRRWIWKLPTSSVPPRRSRRRTPRVAYLCRFTAYEKAHASDPYSSRRGVRQFKTYLLRRLEKDELETKRRLGPTDSRELMRFFELYVKKYLEGPEKERKHYEIASVLFEVLKNLVPERLLSEYDKFMKEMEKPTVSHYNILPLEYSDATQPATDIPEIKAAVDLLLCGIEKLPKLKSDPTSESKEMNVARDLFDWLRQAFGFQMAGQLYDIIKDRRKVDFVPPIRQNKNGDAFLQLIIQPIFSVIEKEASRSMHGTASYSKWRNYDDLNEYFWSKENLDWLDWPMNMEAGFFGNQVKFKSEIELRKDNHVISRRRVPKTNFVELRTFVLLFKSFDRMWSLIILSFQAFVIIAWSPSGSLSAILQPNIFRNVMTIFITDAFLNFTQATLDIAFNWKAWRSLELSQMIRYILKFSVALAWLIILPTAYKYSIQDYAGPVKIFGGWIGSWQSHKSSIYTIATTLYMLPYISGFAFIFLPFQRALEHSNSRIIKCLLWWSQVNLYVARGMYDDVSSILKYTLFWTVLLLCKFTFSFYVEISPLVGLTKKILFYRRHGTYTHEFDLNLSHNLGILVSLWSPIAMDQTKNRHTEEFSDTWNAFIISLRDDDLISNRERDLLIVPSSMAIGEATVFQWPHFIIANKNF